MVPAWIPPAFEVIEAELSFQILVRTLYSPALFDSPYEFLLRDVLGKSCEVKLRRPSFAVLPFHDKPDDLPLVSLLSVVTQRKHSAHGESR